MTDGSSIFEKISLLVDQSTIIKGICLTRYDSRPIEKNFGTKSLEVCEETIPIGMVSERTPNS
jgi:hypothetical protein